RAIRHELAERGLDWDQPPYEPVTQGKPPPPLEVKVDLGNLKVDQGTAFEFLPGGDRTSIGLNSFLLALNPFNIEAYLHRADAYLRLREPEKAIADYDLFLALAPIEHHSHGKVLFTVVDQSNTLAWRYATGSEKQRDPHKALYLAQKAVKLAPEQ